METRTEERPTDDVDRDKPCRIDPRCYRFQGHEGEHLYGDPPRPALHRGEGMTDTDRLDALAAAATPGPWVQSMFVDGREYDHMSKPWKDARQAEEVRMVRSGSAKGQHVALAQDPWNAEADAAFIAACDPATIRSFVAAVRERDELREAAGAFLDEFEAAAAGDVPLDGHYQRQALARLRTALHREDGE